MQIREVCHRGTKRRIADARGKWWGKPAHEGRRGVGSDVGGDKSTNTKVLRGGDRSQSGAPGQGPCKPNRKEARGE